MNVLDLARQKVQLKKASTTAGGEWQGPCPGCGGTDRFHVWPNQSEGKGAYWCRSCGKWGDNIQFLRDFEGMSFRDACARLHIDAPDVSARQSSPPPKRQKPEFLPTAHADPGGNWLEKADKLVSWAAENLARSPEQLSWLSARGISAETAVQFRLGWNPGENGKDLYRPRKVWGLDEITKEDGRPKALWIPRGLVIPYIAGGIVRRIRIRRPEGEPRYYVIPGSSMSTMLLEPGRRAFVVVESELDAIAVVAGNTLAGAVGLGSVAAKPDQEAFAVLSGALSILNALDYDAAGAKAMTWWAGQFKRSARWPVPKGKDPGDAVRMGTDLKRWIEAGLPPALTLEDPAPAPSPIVKRDAEPIPKSDSQLPEELAELWKLLKQNQGVEIINTPQRYTVLRNGRYVGGRINELVFRVPVTRDYLLAHPAERIDWKNIIHGH